MAEIKVNRPLAGNTYLGVVPLTSFGGELQLDGKGQPVDWLVRMKRLPKERMLDSAIINNVVRNDWVQQAAEKLADFYMASTPVKLDQESFRKKLVKDIQIDSTELLNSN
jgi:aminoglycoside phosphotransferase family enzyme